MATLKGGHRGVPPSSGRASGRDGPERQPDGRRLIANRPSSAAVKYTYGPRIKAIFDKWYGLVHNTEQRAAAIFGTASLNFSEALADYHADREWGSKSQLWTLYDQGPEYFHPRYLAGQLNLTPSAARESSGYRNGR